MINLLITNLLAGEIKIGEIKNKNPGPLSNPGDQAGALFGKLISTTIGVMTVVAAIFFLFNIIMGGIAIMSAGGDKGKVEGARTKITNGVIGLVVVISATFIVTFVGEILGFGSILRISFLIDDVSL